MLRDLKTAFNNYMNEFIDVPEELNGIMMNKFYIATATAVIALLLSIFSTAFMAQIGILASVVMLSLFIFFATPVFSNSYTYVEHAELISMEKTFDVLSFRKKIKIMFRNRDTNQRYTCTLSRQNAQVFDQKFSIYFTSDGFENNSDFKKVQTILYIRSYIDE